MLRNKCNGKGVLVGAERKGKKDGLGVVEESVQAKGKGGMGFRDLRAFNLALLAMQGRRIQQSPNSLIHRVLKAKYSAKSSFIDA